MVYDIESVQSFGIPMLQALGVDAKNVLSFRIDCEAGNVPTFTLVRCLPGGSGKAAGSVVEKFRLEPVSAVRGPDLDESVSLDTQVRTTHA